MQQFIDPKTLARVKDLPLVAKTVAEGFLHGLQSSMQRGIGIEFSQYRPYEVGDELSRVDWKLFARSDRYFVREAERESEIDIWFLLDSSRSMMQSSEGSEGQNDQPCLNKLEYAKYLIASLSYIAQKQGDSFGYFNLNDDDSVSEDSYIIADTGERHWRKLLISLANVKPGQFFPNLKVLCHQIQKLQRPSLIFAISDFNQQQNEISDFLAKLDSSRSEVIALQLTCNDELNFDYKGTTRFKDLETGEELLLSPSNTKKAYLKNYHDYQIQLDKNLAKKNIVIKRFNIDKPLDEALHEYLRQRNKVKR